MTFDIGLHEVCVRTGVRYVITKFSGMDGLPNFLTHGAPLRARGSSAINSDKRTEDDWEQGCENSVTDTLATQANIYLSRFYPL